ncbi:MAG: putative immunity protein [Chloroflexales bacterium]
MTNEPHTVALSMQDLRVVARYAAVSAQEALAIFEAHSPDDRRPRLAIAAAWAFAEGAARTKLQRTSALASHQAAREATTEAAREAARAAGHAAAAAYLHPLARATQVKHILGAAAHAARAAELTAGGDQRVGAEHIAQARQRATPELVAVLRRYPAAPAGGNRVAQLMCALDTALRADS